MKNWFIVGGLVLISLSTGCSIIKQSLNNQSLDYLQAKKLPPLQLPINAETQAFVPMYHVPQSGINTLKIENSKGKLYQLPKPYTNQP